MEYGFFDNLYGYGDDLLEGLKVTLAVSICALFVALPLGLLGAWAKVGGSKPVKWLGETYTIVVRGVPELILIILIYYGVPTLVITVTSALGDKMRLDLPSFATGVITLGLIYGAFATEVFRGAYWAVPRGQLEAAKAVGMSKAQMVERILLPQMWRFALPGLGNVWLVLTKATALMSVVQLPELLRAADIAQGATKKAFTFFFAAALIYLAITIVSMALQHRAEAWANRGVRRA